MVVRTSLTTVKPCRRAGCAGSSRYTPPNWPRWLIADKLVNQAPGTSNCRKFPLCAESSQPWLFPSASTKSPTIVRVLNPSISVPAAPGKSMVVKAYCAVAGRGAARASPARTTAARERMIRRLIQFFGDLLFFLVQLGVLGFARCGQVGDCYHFFAEVAFFFFSIQRRRK